MITADIYDFYVNYTGLMTEPEMARELKIPVEKLKEVKKEFAQLSYVGLKNGYITKCERYEEDA